LIAAHIRGSIRSSRYHYECRVVYWSDG
jgi:hypothetical protein